MPLVAATRTLRAGAGARGQAEPQARRPAFGALQQLARRGRARRRGAAAGDQRIDLRLVEAQIALLEFGQFAGGTQPSQSERRLGAAGDHEPPLVGQAVEHLLQQLEDPRIGDAVGIVDDDQAALDRRRSERIDQLAGRVSHTAVGLCERGERLGRDAPRQVVRLERGRQAGKEALQLIVLVGRDPGQGATGGQPP